MRGQATTTAEPGPEARAVLSRSDLPRRGLLGSAGLTLGAAVIGPTGATMSPIAQAAAQPIFTEPPARQEPPPRQEPV